MFSEGAVRFTRKEERNGRRRVEKNKKKQQKNKQVDDDNDLYLDLLKSLAQKKINLKRPKIVRPTIKKSPKKQSPSNPLGIASASKSEVSKTFFALGPSPNLSEAACAGPCGLLLVRALEGLIKLFLNTPF